MIGRMVWKEEIKVDLSAELANYAAEVATGPVDRQPLIAILLSLYNGEQYLQKQLDSILDQTYKNWRVLWHDDGSSDASRAIMAAFANGAGQDRCIETGPVDVCLGAAKSFFSLLQEAGEYRFTAFTDQDDVWLPDKLQLAMERITAQKLGKPILCSARQIIVDKHLKRRKLSLLPRFDAGFPSAFLQNIVTGRTAMLNRDAVQLINFVQPPDNTVHDWSAYIVIAAACGGVIFDPIPEIVYRQHEQNAIGAVSHLTPRALKAIQTDPAPFLRQLKRHAIALNGAKINLPQSARATNACILRALSRGVLFFNTGFSVPVPNVMGKSRYSGVDAACVQAIGRFPLWFGLRYGGWRPKLKLPTGRPSASFWPCFARGHQARGRTHATPFGRDTVFVRLFGQRARRRDFSRVRLLRAQTAKPFRYR